MSKGSRGAIERALEDKYWRQDEGFQAGSRQVPGNLRAREPEDSFRDVRQVMGWERWRSLVPPERSQLRAVT